MFKKTNNIKVNYPDELLSELMIEGIALSTVNDGMGITALSEYKEDKYLLRLHMLVRDEISEEYHVYKELDTFAFKEYPKLIDFLNKLPEMNALDYMVLTAE